MKLATLVLLAAFRFGPELPLANVSYTDHPIAGTYGAAVALDGRDHLAVWTGVGGLMASHFTREGRLLEMRLLAPLPPVEVLDLVWTGQSYMLLIDSRAGLQVMTLASDGKLLTQRALGIEVESWHPRVGSLATNGRNVLVNYGRLLSLDGDPLATVPVELNSAIAAAGDTYLVAGYSDGIATQAVSGDGVVSRPLIIGSTASPVPIIGNSSPFRPAIASDGERFLVAWPTFDGRLLARFVSRDNEPVGDAVVIAPEAPIPPSTYLYLTDLHLAWTGSEYVATFVRGGGSTRGAVAVTIARDLRTQSAPLELRPWPELASEASISSHEDGTGMFVWRGHNGGLLTAPFDQAVLGGPHPLDAIRSVTTGPRDQTEPTVVSNGTAIYAGWTERVAAERAVLVARLGGAPVTIATNVSEFTMAIDGETLWMVWHTTPNQLFAQRFDLALRPVDPAPVLIGTQAPNFNYRHPRIAAAGGAAVLVHENGLPTGGRYDRDPAVRHLRVIDGTIRASQVPVPFTIHDEYEAVVAASSSHFVVSWIALTAGLSPGTNVPDDEVRAVRISRDGVLVDATPFVVRESSQTGVLLTARGTDGVAVITTERYSRRSPEASLLRSTSPPPRRHPLPLRDATAIIGVEPHPSGYMVFAIPESEWVGSWPQRWTLHWTRTDPELRTLAEGTLRISDPAQRFTVTSAGDRIVMVYSRVVADDMGVPFERLFYRETEQALDRRRTLR